MESAHPTPTPDALPGAGPAAVASLYREHHGWLLGLLRRKLHGHHADALDLVQDTFERLLRQPRWICPDRPRGYLTAIATRLLIDRHRRRELEQAYLQSLALQPEATAPAPEAVLQVIEQLSHVCRILDRMPTRMNRAFLLARIDGLPYTDIARELKVSVNVVQKDLVQAWQRLYLAFDDAIDG
ncbi:sigma-70 family RNA polymerase sigma factor [Bordetella sp. N]|uniref:sigma-70 family RNA polymerase sigma factor n=1 Tax=Bordetella sp. N TaxID=1746199 RepID=UPI000ADD9058|nr:sigma-70 family RNA polymerase sigma factor [Bordetella sp. N]